MDKKFFYLLQHKDNTLYHKDNQIYKFTVGFPSQLYLSYNEKVYCLMFMFNFPEKIFEPYFKM